MLNMFYTSAHTRAVDCEVSVRTFFLFYTRNVPRPQPLGRVCATLGLVVMCEMGHDGRGVKEYGRLITPTVTMFPPLFL